MKVNEYLRILRDSEIITEGFEVKEIVSKNEEKILRLGTTIRMEMKSGGIRHIGIKEYFYWDHFEDFEEVELNYRLHKYIIKDILRS